MIRVSRKARAQLASLNRHYLEFERPGAVKNLRAMTAAAISRIEMQKGPFFSAPRPYPSLARPGLMWLKEGPYWIAFSGKPGSFAINGVFYETANIPERL